MIAWPAKDPADVLDYIWTVPLDAGDTISVFTATVASGTISVEGSTSVSGASAITFFSGGAADEVATVTLTATTDDGRTFRDTAALPIINRASALLLSFRLRYSAFVDVGDGPISYWLAQAGVQVSAWPAAAQDAGRLAYAAHKLAEAGQAGALPNGVTGFKSGTFDASVSEIVARRTGFHATQYGREFLDLARIHFGGPRLAKTPTVQI